LDLYDNLHSDSKEKSGSARLNLKQFWMDRVDVQRGRGSINMLAQQLQFVTLRDAFMAVNSEEEVKKTDLNERVKRILSPRVSEYLAWEKLSESELRKRYNIEKSYLKSQVESLKLYSRWAKPYLRAAEKLGMADFNSPDLVSTFNNMQLEVNLIGKREVKPSSVNEEWDGIKLKKKYYQVIEVLFKFRSVPHTIKQTQGGVHYAQGGRVWVNFRGFGLDEDEIKFIENEEAFEGLKYVEGMTTDTLEVLQEDLKNYLDEEKDNPEGKLAMLKKEREEAETKADRKQFDKDIEILIKKIKREAKNPGPAVSLKEGIKEILGPLKKIIPEKSSSHIEAAVREGSKSSANKTAYVIYNVYKKAHGMYTE